MFPSPKTVPPFGQGRDEGGMEREGLSRVQQQNVGRRRDGVVRSAVESLATVGGCR